MFKRFMMTGLAVLLCAGCASSRVAPDKAAIEQGGQIGCFIWHVTPYFSTVGGGTVGNLANPLTALVMGTFGKARTAMYESGVYEAFEEEFPKVLNSKMNVRAVHLDMTKLKFTGEGKEKKTDPAASASDQGFPLLLEAYVAPSITESTGANTYLTTITASVRVTATLTRLSDKKVLWKELAGENRTCPSIDSCGITFKEMAKSTADRIGQAYSNAGKAGK